jgi:hypothetical protein
MLAHGGNARRGGAGYNVLHGADNHGTSEECFRELLIAGADPRGHGYLCDETPMHVVADACFHSDGPERAKLLDLLFDAGASPRVTPPEALQWFSEHGDNGAAAPALAVPRPSGSAVGVPPTRTVDAGGAVGPSAGGPDPSGRGGCLIM